MLTVDDALKIVAAGLIGIFREEIKGFLRKLTRLSKSPKAAVGGSVAGSLDNKAEKNTAVEVLISTILAMVILALTRVAIKLTLAHVIGFRGSEFDIGMTIMDWVLAVLGIAWVISIVRAIVNDSQGTQT
jgi:hypothetical protein